MFETSPQTIHHLCIRARYPLTDNQGVDESWRINMAEDVGIQIACSAQSQQVFPKRILCRIWCLCLLMPSHCPTESWVERGGPCRKARVITPPPLAIHRPTYPPSISVVDQAELPIHYTCCIVKICKVNMRIFLASPREFAACSGYTWSILCEGALVSVSHGEK
ncbi:hypothetical protein BDV93DRAFT_294093 [Ceratobasidium sp. AG-I]|nr:hypothetical protein BDV93DRAFT_294093 [Ceratobasidium sp. AG-I]